MKEEIDVSPTNEIKEQPYDTDSTPTLQTVKDMDADSLIDFFKNTPKDKLHEILEGANISFNIHFGKNTK